MLSHITLYIISSNKFLFKNYVECVSNLAKKHNLKIKGPINLPVKSKIFTFLRSVHVYKTSSEQFSVLSYRGFFIFYFDLLTYFNVFYFLMFLKFRTPLGLNITIKKKNYINN